MKHPDRETMERFISRDLGALRSILVAGHLKKCADCARLAAEVEKENELIRTLKAAHRKYRDFERSGQADAVLAGLENRFGRSRAAQSGSA